MSDFGAIVKVYRSDGAAVERADEGRVREAILAVRGDEEGRIGPYDHFAFDLSFSYRLQGGRGFGIFLTAYWLGDEEGNGGLGPEALLARDGPDAERFAGELQEVLGPEYQVEPYVGFW